LGSVEGCFELCWGDVVAVAMQAVLLADVLAYRDRLDAEAEDALAAMTAEAEDLGLYDE
jgi:hypothetical protein